MSHSTIIVISILAGIAAYWIVMALWFLIHVYGEFRQERAEFKAEVERRG